MLASDRTGNKLVALATRDAVRRGRDLPVTNKIRTKLQRDRRTRDLAMFNLAIDSKLRGCDVVALRLGSVDIHRSARAEPTRWIIAVKLSSVLS
jgi:hypothetical protein